MNIVLCGMPGSGKTTVATRLADLCNKTAVDTDALIVQKHGKITEIFANFGEEYFRSIETEVCKNLSQKSDLIIATGGGCVLREQNVKYLKVNGKIVFLRASIKTLLQRLKGDTNRPLLAGNLELNLFNLICARTQLYMSIADIVIDTDGFSPDEIAQKIITLLH